jgi:hypothetical protein
MADDDAPYKVVNLEYAESSKDGTFAELSFLRKDAPPLILTIPTARLQEAALSLIAAANHAYELAEGALDPQIPVAEYVEVHGGPDYGRVDLHFQLNATADLPISLDLRAASVLWEQLHVILAGRPSSPTGGQPN